VKAVSGALSERAMARFFVTIDESKGAVWETYPFVTCERSFGAIFEWAPSQFSLSVYESTKAVGADESIRHMRKKFRGQLLSGQRLSFPLLFMSHEGLFGLTNPFATCESSIGGYI